MPRVPTYDNFQIDPIGLPSARMTATPVQTTATDQAQAMGQQMMGAGGQMAKMALQMQEQIDLSRADEASNKLKEAAMRLTYDEKDGYTTLRGNNALERPDGKPLDMEYGERLTKYRDEIAAGLGNDAQRAAFMRNAGSMQSNFQGNLLKHMADESASYQLSVQDGIINTALREVGLADGNEAIIHNATQRVEGALWKTAQLKGYAADWVTNTRIKLLDSAHAGHVSGLIDSGKLDVAEAYISRNFQNMGDASLQKFNSMLTEQKSIALGMQIGSAAVQSAASQTTPQDQARYPTGADKSGAARGIRNNNPGNIVKGSQKWLGQVEGSDSRFVSFSSPEAGIRALGKNLIAYQEKHKLDTVATIIKRWAPPEDNNDTASYAATVAKQLGVGANDRINLRDKRTLGILTKAIISVENGKGQHYSDAQINTGIEAALGNKELSSKAPQATQATSTASDAPSYLKQTPRISKAEVVQAALADPRLANNPIARKAAIEAAEKSYELQENQRKTNADNAMAQALEYGAQVGWRMSELPPSIKSQVPAEDWGKLQGLFEKQAKGDNTTNTQAYARYFNSEDGRQELRGMSRSRAVLIASGSFNESDGKAFIDLWGQVNGVTPPKSAADAASKAGDLDRAAFKATAEHLLRQIGFTDKGGKNSEGAKQMATAMYVLERQILRMQQGAGKKFNDAELAAALDKITSATTNLKGFGFSKDESIPIINIARNGDYMNDALKAKLTSDLKAKGISNPSETQIKTAYLMHRLGHVK